MSAQINKHETGHTITHNGTSLTFHRLVCAVRWCRLIHAKTPPTRKMIPGF
jgi:hypothetical protein